LKKPQKQTPFILRFKTTAGIDMIADVALPGEVVEVMV